MAAKATVLQKEKPCDAVRIGIYLLQRPRGYQLYAWNSLVAAQEVSVSQDSVEVDTHHQLLDALCLCLSDLQTVAYAALRLMREEGSPGTVAYEMDAARLQGLGDNLLELQSWVIKYGNPFPGADVHEQQLLTRLMILHLQAKQAITKPELPTLPEYFENLADVINLLKSQPNVSNILYLMGTLQVALKSSTGNMRGTAPKQSHKLGPPPRPKASEVDVFIAAGKTALKAAEELAMKLGISKVSESLSINPFLSWLELPELSQHPLAGVRTTISRCQYGVLILAPEETAVDRDAKDSDKPTTGHFRLGADVEFMLGLMTGVFGIKKTFIVVPKKEKDRADLASLLAGLTLATYDPGAIGAGNAMSLACTQITSSISKGEEGL
jgi:predicted nucleotide-binding protein